MWSITGERVLLRGWCGSINRSTADVILARFVGLWTPTVASAFSHCQDTATASLPYKSIAVDLRAPFSECPLLRRTFVTTSRRCFAVVPSGLQCVPISMIEPMRGRTAPQTQQRNDRELQFLSSWSVLEVYKTKRRPSTL